MKESHIQKFNTVYQSSGCYYGQELRPEFTAHFGNQDIQGLQALDLGCGEGRYALYLARKGCEVTAIDRTPAGIQKLRALAQNHYLHVIASVVDIADFIFPENRFDIIVAATVLDHLGEDLRRRTIAGMRSALKPGGILYVNVFTVDDPGYLLKQTAAGENPLPGADSDVSDTAFCMEYYFTPNELRSCFNGYTLLYYYEGVEPDLSHGRPHHHGWACLLARKP
ncbi:MAG: class I SAM-dependent methyltransferase [Desulfobacteraceae bacterium]|nr:class I SAM-dependent methyltransferase [Desulfobacteraceae bacterium]